MATSDMVKGRLLDIGCGVGDFLLQVKKLGWEVMGIEPSEQAANIAQSRLGFTPLKPTDYEKLPDQSFDVITMWHVLEHVDDLKFQTKELKRLLRPGGRLVIALPNYQSFDCQYYNNKWAAWDVPRHLNHFTQDCLQGILNANDFKYIDTQRLIWDAYYISFLSEKYLGHSLPLIRGAWVGLKSNCKARRSGMYSSLVYRYEKQ
jgi:2-polyprenyl-3-methyl-5-hydroxy-6-metoxy-1,4-benzoquinol methylase